MTAVHTRSLPRPYEGVGTIGRTIGILGLIGVAIAILCVALVPLTGLRIPPEGDLTKAISFDAAVGIYLLTIGLFVPFARFSPKGGRRWLAWSIGLVLYAYGTETIQTLRGLDPRFSHFFTPVDQVLGALFGVVAIGLIVLFSILTAKLFARGTEGENGLLLLSIRYACYAAFLAFAAGIWMIAVQGRKTGISGNLIPLHAAGFHGLQAIPLLAVLLARSDIDANIARRTIHIAGFAWIGLCAAVLIQTAVGRPVTDVSPETLSAAALFALWAVCALFAFSSWWVASREVPAV